MKEEEILAEKIKNGSTELQRAYSATKQRISQLIKANGDLSQEIQDNEIEIGHLHKTLDKCKQRAAEQGYPNLF